MPTEHLPHVAWDPTSASPIECVVGLTKCITAGHFLPEAKANPGLVVRNFGRFADFVAEQLSPGPKPVFASAEDEQAFEAAVEELAASLGVRTGLGGALTRMFLLMIVRQLGEAIQEWLESLDDDDQPASQAAA